ncbi:MAG: pre-16S rRNA-processing nuclease YqgF [Deinococcus sp.]|nr:pre-16S rRNA-processing nuclease YqgF [Deinococcus sp.]
MRILALDPGEKIGMALLEGEQIVHRAVLSLEELEGIRPLVEAHPVVLGNGTGSKRLAAKLKAWGISYQVVDEQGTSLEARRLYFRHHPPRGLRRLIPLSLQVPPVPYDDYAAAAIGLRWLRHKGTKTG